MLPETLPPPIWVDKPATLAKLAVELGKYPRLAVDTESNSLHAYREQVCLVQFSTPNTDYLVDPLALADLSPLGPIFSNPNIEKIFHACEYDVYCLHRDFGFDFENIYDTMIAARTLGCQAVGLGNLLFEKFGIDLDKHHQKADWAKRPLTPSQVDYARLDTHYLHGLRDVLDQELYEKERHELAAEDFVRLRHPATGNGKSLRPCYERVSGNQDLSPRELTILNELCLCREKAAQRLNRPVFKVIGDDRLISLAKAAPETHSELKTAGVTPYQAQRFGDWLLTAIRKGKTAPPIERGRPERLPDAVLTRLDKLKKWRKLEAEKMFVESDIILPRPYLQTIAEENPRSMEELAKILCEAPWRLEHFGTDILKTLGVKTI